MTRRDVFLGRCVMHWRVYLVNARSELLLLTPAYMRVDPLQSPVPGSAPPSAVFPVPQERLDDGAWAELLLRYEARDGELPGPSGAASDGGEAALAAGAAAPSARDGRAMFDAHRERRRLQFVYYLPPDVRAVAPRAASLGGGTPVALFGPRVQRWCLTPKVGRQQLVWGC
jgi:hypothetical protein